MMRRQRLLGISLAVVAVSGTAGIVGVVTRAGDATFAGVVSPATVTALQVTSPGRIAQVLVHPGDRVHQGQLLARLESTVLDAVIAADRADLAATQARLVQLQTPSAAPEASGRLAILAAKAAQQVTFAEQDASASAAVLAGARQQASALLNSLTQKQAADTASQQQVCPGGAPAGPAEQVARCAVLAGQVAQDAIEVTRQQNQVTQASAEEQRAGAASAHAIAAAQVGAQLAQAQQGLPPAGAATDITAAGADLTKAQAVLVRDEAYLAAASIVAPAAGVVLAVGGSAGELAEPAGVRQAPAALSPAQAVASASPVAPSAPAAAAAPVFQPLITLQTGDALQVTVQIAETDLKTFPAGRHATATVNGADASRLQLALVGLEPISTSGKLTFAAVFTTTGAPPANVRPGSTANVVLG